jgi:hypothetical protein
MATSITILADETFNAWMMTALLYVFLPISRGFVLVRRRRLVGGSRFFYTNHWTREIRRTAYTREGER